MAIHKTCDGIQRRDFLKAGALGASGLTLSAYLRMLEAGEVSEAKAKSAIFIDLAGGPSHIDTFDPKPNAPSEYRGEFHPIQTNVPGIEFSEHLPLLARNLDKFALLRNVTHPFASHGLGERYVNTGNRPSFSLEYPGYGAVVTKEKRSSRKRPPFVGIPKTNQKAGFLGLKYAPLNVGGPPRPGRAFSVRGITLRRGLTLREVEKRNDLLKDLDQTFKGFEADDQLLAGLDRFSQQAHAIITSKQTRLAFDVSQESPAFAKPYGTTPFGMSCLLATRLIESGVRFVAITLGGWDTHGKNWSLLKDRLLPPFDEGFAALLNGLQGKGLLSTTAVFVTGEFGRTPKINKSNGRDHYSRCMFMLMAGGGVRGGQVIGESDDKATMPRGDGYSPDDVAASFYYNLGIDHTKEYQTDIGRPIMLVRHGKVIRELFG
jgi:hypothetical protein